jgi:signal transduction histidine kinase
MALELAEMAAGLPMAASLAVASGISTVRESRRRASLNQAMHELRRPLQVLALALPADPREEGACESSLRVATAALERLDREINGRPAAARPHPVLLKPLVETAVRRWQGPARLRGRGLRVSWWAANPEVIGDEFELAQALDNVLNNALDHGAGTVTVEVREREGRACLAVVDGGGKKVRSSLHRDLRDRVGGRNRHGHGLRLVARTVRAHGGIFRLRRSPGRTEARIELPLLGAGKR